MVEVLVRDEQPVDGLRGQLERGRGDEPVVMGADPGVDDEPDASDFDPEACLPEPGQPTQVRPA
jgi:hypothetical protein